MPVTVLLPLTVQKADCKTFCPMSRIGPVTASPAPHRQISYPVSTSHRSDLCKNVSLQCYVVATVIHRPSVSSQTCGHIHMLFTIREAGRAKEMKKIGAALNAAYQGYLSACNFGYACHRDGSPVLRHFMGFDSL